MKKVRTDLLKEWIVKQGAAGMEIRFPKPADARGFYPWGFVRKNDSAADFADWYGLSLCLEEKKDMAGEDREAVNEGEEAAVEGLREAVDAAGAKAAADTACAQISVTVYFADQEPLTAVVRTIVQSGRAKAETPFSIFPLETAKGNRWEFVTGFEISWEPEGLALTGCIARRREGIYAAMPVKGKAGRAGECLIYEGEVYNCAEEPLCVTAEQVFEGWECVIAGLQLERNMLAPGEGTAFSAAVTVPDSMVPGGHENTRLRLRGQGSMQAYEECLELKTLCSLPHPYLYHDKAGWQQVKENAESCEAYRRLLQEYGRIAEQWTPAAPREGKPFCYETKEETFLMPTAYLYALTGEQKYAGKIAEFFRYFSNPAKGYPARKRGCSQSYVQEGHFFKHLASAYDIICESGELTKEDREAVEQCFRLYMDTLDRHILDGHISNWILSEVQGALFCALAIQDMDRALRFAFGRGGAVDQFRYGIFNDGWWHECSVGYNTWVASMMLHIAHALLPFGYNLVHTHFQIPYNSEVSSTWRMRPSKVKSGMYNLKWGKNRKNYVCIKDMFDATLPFLDYRGVLFGIADSDEKKLSGEHFGPGYDLAYFYYRDQSYLPVIRDNEPDPIFGDPKLDTTGASYYAGNASADNIGLALLRSRKKGREQREQIQAVLRYGSHGNAHGHFDITDLLSVMRYGRSFFNPENCWWGYAHFMYKFYVQNSLTKNMVVVDDKMQIPADSKRILWHSEEGLQAAGIEVTTRWAYPPYGGMVYEQDGQTATKEELRKRCRLNGCFLPILEGEDSPVYGEMSGYTEPILQRRVMAVTDDYIVLFDYVQGEQEHRYDSLMQIKGFRALEGEGVRHTGHTEQMDDNPVSEAQFITDCDWYEVQGESVARFLKNFTEEESQGERRVCDRSNYNEPGDLHMDVHTAWPPRTEQMVGRVAVYTGWAADVSGYTIPLSYQVKTNGAVAAQGAFDGWILGRGEIDADIRSAQRIELTLRQGCMYNEIKDPVKTPQGVFWGEICLELADGRVLNLGECLAEAGSAHSEWARSAVRMENVDPGCGIGRDYQGGRVTIVGTEYPFAIPASPEAHEKESRICVDLSGLGALRLRACVGVDVFPGDESQNRKTYAVRTSGKTGRFVTVIEPYESLPMVMRAEAAGPDSVTVTLADGRVERISLTGMETGKVQIRLDKGKADVLE